MRLPWRDMRIKVEEIAMSNYHISMSCSKEDGGYIADMRDLEARSTFRGTSAQAVAEAERDRVARLEAAPLADKPCVPSRYRPLLYQTAP